MNACFRDPEARELLGKLVRMGNVYYDTETFVDVALHEGYGDYIFPGRAQQDFVNICKTRKT